MSMLPGFFLDAVVGLERLDPDSPDDDPKFVPLGSGVLLGRDGTEPDGTPTMFVYLATNRHVVENETEVYAKFNVGSDAPAERLLLGLADEDGRELWFGHDEFDVAVTFIQGSALMEAEVEIAPIPEDKWLDLAAMEDAGVAAGDDVFVLGFPLGLMGKERKYTIVRSGSIARLDSDLVGETKGFLLDCMIFPGNSGGPVALKPSRFIDHDEDPPAMAYFPPDFIGIVSGYIPYTDVAISEQTKKPRIIFEENSGLASVVPVDAIRSAIQAHEDLMAELEAAGVNEQQGEDHTSGTVRPTHLPAD